MSGMGEKIMGKAMSSVLSCSKCQTSKPEMVLKREGENGVSPHGTLVGMSHPFPLEAVKHIRLAS